MFYEPLGSMIFICRGIALDGIVCDGFCQTIQVYISLDSKIYFWAKKQKYFWIHQKYIETYVSNPPIAVFIIAA